MARDLMLLCAMDMEARLMTAGQRMTTHVVALPESATLGDAVDLSRSRHIHHIPVLRAAQVVGMVDERDMLRALPSAVAGAGPDEYQRALEAPIARVMTRDPECVDTATPLADAIERMMKAHVTALPVTEGGRLVGILTATDCQRALLEMLRLSRSPKTAVG